MRPFLSLSFALAAVAAMAPFAWAHFRLLEPASWIEENNLGDPQKLGPCGGTSASARPGPATGPPRCASGSSSARRSSAIWAAICSKILSHHRRIRERSIQHRSFDRTLWV